MTDPLSRMLARSPHVLADGATGTALMNMGLGQEPAELWNLTRPAEVARHYRAAVDAGSDLFLTNSFAANASRMRLPGLADQVTDLNRQAAAIAREVADAAGRPVIVAGSMGPIGEFMAPMGSLTHARAVEMFHQQAEALREGGADILWVETLASLEELRAAAEAARRVGMAWCGSLSFDTAGRTMMGVTPSQLAAAVETLPNPPVAYGANCGIGASDLLRTVAGFVASGNERPIIAKGNAGVPHLLHGDIHYDGTPELMADYACLARDMGVQVIGGCCGTMPAHLCAMREALETRPRGPRPTLDQITAQLGAFASARH
ncbi:betaine--homocysteine S-methyltransferase [Paracoccus aestuarii]|uniref:Betaine--homocysteine S-methyltransferase n=1 Tax=Paracoccus aestuarii TaxID=453842 RepID=A0A419A260_9RHOB|nr:betaine--homocysteine S-methyltransferase [Paracoccus aestuarii]RJL07185.1 betaine--homocysteine S-methyltransferase [Paracoccus aestuarii]WCQ99601.1 betaine--homocysteine S-methyltransferase [Paracoccus aestuarii]